MEIKSKEQLPKYFTIYGHDTIYERVHNTIIDSDKEVHAEQYMIYGENLRCHKYLLGKEVMVEIPLNKIIEWKD